MIFNRHPLTREFARILRASARARRPEIDGHRFRYDDLKELWVSADQCHAVLIHDEENCWQYWHNPPTDGGWQLMGLHPSREEAQKAAEMVRAPTPGPGTYFLAWLPDSLSTHTIRVRCTTPYAIEALTGIFEKLGYDTNTEEVRELRR